MATAITPVAESLREYGRGLTGGLLFSLPLLYTMEMWASGFIARPLNLIGYLLFTFALLLGYNRFAGIREDATWGEVAIDSVEELGLSVCLSAGALFLIGQIGPQTSFHEGLGMVVVESGVVAIGFSVGTAQLGGVGAHHTGKRGDDRRGKAHATGAMIVAFCGAVLFGGNIAPTEEVTVIAAETPPLRLAALAVISIILGGLILHFIDFARSDRFVYSERRLDALAGSVVTYAIAVVGAAVILWSFGRFDGNSLDAAVRQIVVLGLPATIGAAVGRLLLQS